MADFTYNALGGISLFTGDHCEDLFDLAFDLNLFSDWTNEGSGDPNFFAEVESSWDAYADQYYWYRVEGTYRSYEIQNQPCNTRDLSLLIAAKNMKQLCQRLKTPLFGPKVRNKISKIYRSIYPIGSGNGSSTLFIEQEFCECSDCEEFCIDVDLTSFSFHDCVAYEPIAAYAEVAHVYQPESSGIINIGGNAQILRFWFPKLPGSFSGITLSGSSEVISPYFTYYATGGITVDSDDIDFIVNPLIRSATGSIYIGGVTGDVISPDQQYVAQGGIEISSSSETNFYCEYNVANCIDYINISGDAEITILTLNYITESSGGIEISGESEIEASYYFYQASGAITLSGNNNDIVSTNRSYVAQGGIEVSGEIDSIYREYAAQGGMDLFGSLYEVHVTNRFVPSGSIYIGGLTGDVISPDQNYLSQGQILISGTSELNFTNLGVLDNFFAFYDSIFNSSIESEILDSVPTIVIPTTSVCACTFSSTLLTLNHNIDSSGVLDDFLLRNNLTLSKNLIMSYKKTTNSWTTTQHLRGYGNDGKSIENWYINFSLACTNLINAQSFNNNNFKFNLFVRKQNLTNRTSHKTNLYTNIRTDDVCVNRNILTHIQYNLFNNKFVVDDRISNTGKLSDEIGLFENSYWNQVKNYDKVRDKKATVPETTGIFPFFKINIKPNKIMETTEIPDPQKINL